MHDVAFKSEGAEMGVEMGIGEIHTLSGLIDWDRTRGIYHDT
jgi:hypothetical protein